MRAAGEVLVTVSASGTTEASAGIIGPTGRPLPVFPNPEPLLKHGPARVVAVCNQKGGVGKTTTTISLGAALAELGRRVLLVDFDPQGALSVGLGFQPHELDATVYNVLMDAGVTAGEVLFQTKVDGMDLLPSNIDLSGAEVQLVHEVGREFVLGRVLAPLLPEYDIVLIDCQPSLGLLTVNALACSDGVLVPLECEYFAMRGVALLMETIDKVSNRLSPKLTMDGLLATMYDSRTPPTGSSPGRCLTGGTRPSSQVGSAPGKSSRDRRAAAPGIPAPRRIRAAAGQRPRGPQPQDHGVPIGVRAP